MEFWLATAISSIILGLAFSKLKTLVVPLPLALLLVAAAELWLRGLVTGFALGLGCSTGAATTGLEGAGGGSDLRFSSLVKVGERGEVGDSIGLVGVAGDCTGGEGLLAVSVLALGRVYCII